MRRRARDSVVDGVVTRRYGSVTVIGGSGHIGTDSTAPNPNGLHSSPVVDLTDEPTGIPQGGGYEAPPTADPNAPSPYYVAPPAQTVPEAVPVGPYDPTADPYSDAPPPTVVDPVALAAAMAADQRGRAVALFVEVPLLAFVAFSPQVPGLVRLGAAALGIYRAVEVATQHQEWEVLLPQGS